MAGGPLDMRGITMKQGGAHNQIRLVHVPPTRPSLARDAALRAITEPVPPPIAPTPPVAVERSLLRGRKPKERA